MEKYQQKMVTGWPGLNQTYWRANQVYEVTQERGYYVTRLVPEKFLESRPTPSSPPEPPRDTQRKIIPFRRPLEIAEASGKLTEPSSPLYSVSLSTGNTRDNVIAFPQKPEEKDTGTAALRALIASWLQLASAQ